MEGKSAIESIHKRIGHISVPYKFFVIVWSGFVGAYGLTRQNPNAPIKHRCNKNEKTCRAVRSTYCPSDIVWFYNCLNGLWFPRQTTGQIPQKTSGSSAAVLDDHLYIFGGMIEFAGNSQRHQNDLYRLHLPSLVWEKLSPSGIKPPRCDKGVAWAYEGKVYFFGGYGPRPDLASMNFVFQADITNSNGRMGWNNNFFAYDPFSNSWFKPNTRGVTPDPRAAHSACIVDSRAFIFGGRMGEARTNDLYFIDMSTLTWSRNINAATDRDGPEGRSWLSFNFVSRRKAVVYGGLRQYGIPAMDYWECEFSENYERLVWTKCVTPIEPRVWHQASFCENTHELVIVGGVSKSPYDMEEEDHIDQMKIIAYEPSTLYRLSLNAVVDLYDNSTAKLKCSLLPKVLSDLVISRSIQNVILRS
uniref:Kelch domain-containing protein 2 n=1 Tax=Lygus hesperus TaxID=30085 RepID=A0A0A9Z3F3_LYGHE